MRSEIVINKAWRSELALFAWYVVTGAVSILLSNFLPDSVLYGPLFSMSKSETVFLGLPLFWLIPATIACWILVRIFDVRYALNSIGVEAIRGRISLNQKICKLRYEDIRSLEVRQTLLGRILNVGDVLIGTAGTSELEAVLEGVFAPREIQEMIQRERKLTASEKPKEEPLERIDYDKQVIGSE